MLRDLGSSSSLRQLATSIVTAGVTSGLTNGLGLDNSVTAGFAEKLQVQAVRTAVSTAAEAAINGGDLGEQLVNSLVSSAVTLASAPLFEAIGDLEGLDGPIGTIAEGDVTKVLAHAAAGCAVGQASSQNCLAGAVGAGLQELVGGALSDDPRRNTELSGLVGAVAVALAGGDAEAIYTADRVGQMAATFNRQLHTAEIRALEQKAAELDGVDGKSAAEWKEALGREALRRVDAAYAAALGEADPSAAQYLDALAAAFAAETGSTGFVDAMGSQLNFLARDAQFENYAYLATEIKADAAFYDIVLADYAAPGGDALGDLLSPSDRLRADALSAASVSALVGGAEPSTLTTEQQIARNLTLQEAALQARELSLELIALDATLESQLEVARAQFDTAEIRTLEAQRSELNDRIGDLFTTSGAVQWRFTADFAVGFASGASETAQATYETILGGIAALNQYMIDQGGVLIGDENALANNRARTDALVGLLARGVDNLAHIDELPQALIDGTLGAFSALAESLAEINTAYHNADYEAIGVLSEQIAVTAATELIPAIRAGDKASDIADLADLARIGGGRAPEFEVPNSVAGSFDGAGGIWNRNSPLQVEYFPSGSVVGKGNQPLCGPASCTMIVRDRTGDTVDLGAITNQFNGVRTTGVNGVEMSTVLSNNGIDNQFISSMNSTQLNSVLDSNQPVIVNVRAGEGGHWIVVDSRIEVDGQSYYNVRDPNAGSGAGGGYGVQTDFLISNWNGGNAIVID